MPDRTKNLEKIVDTVVTTISTHNRSLQRLGEMLKGIAANQNILKDRFDTLEGRIHTLESKTQFPMEIELEQRTVGDTNVTGYTGSQPNPERVNKNEQNTVRSTIQPEGPQYGSDTEGTNPAV